MGVDGSGIGKVDGRPLFVKDAIIGDKVLIKIMRMKKHYGYARLLDILEPSPDRIEPLCSFHRQCGGCQLQALAYEKQLDFKQNKVKNNLQRIGGLHLQNEALYPIIGMEKPFFYRNKAQFPIGRDKDGNTVAGFYASRTHIIIANHKCYLGVAVNEQILDIVLSFMKKWGIAAYDEKTGTGLIRHVLVRFGFTTKEIMVCLVINGTSLKHSEHLIEKLCKLDGMTSITLNINTKNTNVILGNEIRNLWGQDYITDYIAGIKFQISPLSFYQINPIQTSKLYQTVLEYAGLTGKETVWDLYCGIGTISLFLAQKAKQVYGVELVPQAIADAKHNAKINGIENVDFFVGKAEEILPEYDANVVDPAKKTHVDVIVVDPPRKGCEQSLLDAIATIKPEKLIYVSCDSATLARDLKYLCERGFLVERIQPIDMFGSTVHVESVVLTSRKDS
ncbi:23S rRNA (uracil(1939)-C(5))-methyltransferase RlmD [Lachnospiraceae bacterium ZAX-1]